MLHEFGGLNNYHDNFTSIVNIPLPTNNEVITWSAESFCDPLLCHKIALLYTTNRFMGVGCIIHTAMPSTL